ncbi:hypothetical protein G195_011362 [Phytophthora kernoviae 00238/432]|uniref:CCHC-type domain-containing protein n=1 Tax=Phytophthora kernoviae 00238/432 TaxID=1284355 RepID=A0A8J4S252_9STRA|nr:hypothetical protein G195_011362 [Phytophthora kernoviae 00238/432]
MADQDAPPVPPPGNSDPNVQADDTTVPEALSTTATVPAALSEGNAASRHDPAVHQSGMRTLNATSGGPFAMPQRECAGEVDVDMEDVSEDISLEGNQRDRVVSAELGRHVQTMPTLPKPPTFRGSTTLEKQRFMKDYEAYCRQLSALETAFFRPFRMPVGACVEDERRRLIAMFDICKPLENITEKDWINYFWEGRIVGELDFDKVKALMSGKLRMDGELKKVVNYLIGALAPEQFQRTIKNEMAREANKPLYKNVVGFIKWLRTGCKEYLRWEPANTKKQQTETSREKLGSARQPNSKGATEKPNASRGSGATRKRTCLKCSSSDHRVKDCPKVKPGEAETLLREWREKRAAAQAATRTVPPVYHVKALHLSEGTWDTGSSCQVKIENSLELDNVLLDSGADVNVASRSLVARLQDDGVVVRLETFSLRRLSTFNGNVITVTQRAWFDTIQICTSAGPLLLRRTPAWIFGDEGEPLRMVLSRLVMERLGYSVDAILAKAFSKPTSMTKTWPMRTGEQRHPRQGLWKRTKV